VIASLSGTVVALPQAGVVLRVGGIGLAVQTTPGTRARLRVGEEATLSTSLVVREDSLTLYGFADEQERELFELLQSSSGVGPKLAQAVLTVHTPEGLQRALLAEDLVALCLVPGIGRKGAQRLVLELKDKIAAGPRPASDRVGQAPWRDTLSSALVGLGWTGGQADDAVVRLAQAHPGASDGDVPVLLREALALLGRAR
jgi:Holliday junction DNA helicase RuvA